MLVRLGVSDRWKTFRCYCPFWIGCGLMLNGILDDDGVAV